MFREAFNRGNNSLFFKSFLKKLNKIYFLKTSIQIYSFGFHNDASISRQTLIIRKSFIKKEKKHSLQNKIHKPANDPRMLGRPGESGSGKASNNGVRSCKFDLLNEVAAKLGCECQIKLCPSLVFI